MIEDTYCSIPFCATSAALQNALTGSARAEAPCSFTDWSTVCCASVVGEHGGGRCRSLCVGPPALRPGAGPPVCLQRLTASGRERRRSRLAVLWARRGDQFQDGERGTDVRWSVPIAPVFIRGGSMVAVFTVLGL